MRKKLGGSSLAFNPVGQLYQNVNLNLSISGSAGVTAPTGFAIIYSGTSNYAFNNSPASAIFGSYLLWRVNYAGDKIIAGVSSLIDSNSSLHRVSISSRILRADAATLEVNLASPEIVLHHPVNVFAMVWRYTGGSSGTLESWVNGVLMQSITYTSATTPSLSTFLTYLPSVWKNVALSTNYNGDPNWNAKFKVHEFVIQDANLPTHAQLRAMANAGYGNSYMVDLSAADCFCRFLLNEGSGKPADSGRSAYAPELIDFNGPPTWVTT